MELTVTDTIIITHYYFLMEKNAPKLLPIHQSKTLIPGNFVYILVFLYYFSALMEWADTDYST